MIKDILYVLGNPFRALAKYSGFAVLMRFAWRAEYKRGKHLHNLRTHGRSSICEHIERYSNNGDVLDLGCSDGHVGLGLSPLKCRSYTGVDISEIGIRKARTEFRLTDRNVPSKNQFFVRDISQYVPEHLMDVILFKDSLYYIKKKNMLSALKQLQKFLTQSGVFIVQMDDLRRHSWIRDLIRKNFTIIEDEEFQKEDFMRLIFR